MRRTNRSGNFFICLIFNILLNWEGIIPAAVLAVLHFWLGWPLWLAFAALGLWILGIIVRMLLLGWANKCGNSPDPPKENKNPYSLKDFPIGKQ